MRQARVRDLRASQVESGHVGAALEDGKAGVRYLFAIVEIDTGQPKRPRGQVALRSDLTVVAIDANGSADGQHVLGGQAIRIAELPLVVALPEIRRRPGLVVTD